jgi:glycosyltransferase involved in cell wall biosynthesis
MKTKILYIHHDASISGSGISLRNLLMGIDRDRYFLRVLLAQDGPSRKLFEDLHIPVDVIPIRGLPTSPGHKWYAIEHWKAWLCFIPNPKLKSYLLKLKPDLVHVNDKMLLAAGIASKRIGVPVIWHSRSTYKVTASRINKWISRLLIRRFADQIIAISEDETDGFDDLKNLSIINNSVDFGQVADAWNQRSSIISEFSLQDKIVIGSVSTGINEVRGTFDFIRAVSIAKQQLPDVNFKFLIVAPIPQKPFTADYQKAIHLAQDLHVDQELIFTGFRRDALAIMSAMNIAVVCNRHRVLGRMPFEAMALGVPVIVTAGHSGKSGVVIDGDTALVVPTGDPQSIANSIIKLLGDPELCSRMSERGKAYAHRFFDPQINTQKVEKIYEEVIGNRVPNKNHDK